MQHSQSKFLLNLSFQKLRLVKIYEMNKAYESVVVNYEFIIFNFNKSALIKQ